MMKRLALLAGVALALCCTVATAAPAPMPDTEPAFAEFAVAATPAARDANVTEVFVLQHRQAECLVVASPVAALPGLVFASFSPTSPRALSEVRPSPGRPGAGNS